MAQLGEKEKCDTCITKALAIDSSCADAYIVRARVSTYRVGFKFHLSVCSGEQ